MLVQDLSPRSLGLAIAVAPERDHVLVVPEGELDITTVGAVRHKVAALRARGFPSVVLDLHGVTFADSSLLHLLYELESAAAADGFAFAIRIGASGPARRLLDVAGLADRFAVA
jgi:anti-sigma B factor antagonist